MKILFTIPTLNQGGAERVISELANYLSKMDIEIHLAILVKSKDFYKIEDQVVVHEIGNPINNKISKIISIIKTSIKLRALMKNNSYHSIISFLPQSNLLTLFCALGLKQKVFVSERNSPTTWGNHSKAFILARNILYKYAYGFIAQTNDAKKAFSSMYPNCYVETIPNPIKKIDFLEKVEKEKIILNVGRLERQKGQIDLINAFYKANLKDWKLVILGKGSLSEKLKMEAKRLNIENQILIPGAVSNIDEWYFKSEIFVFPSYFEGFPNALAEAMSSGLPSISYDCDTGPRDLIKNNKNGFLVPVGDIEKLTNKIKFLANNTTLKNEISNEAKKVSEIYSIEHISNLLLNFIEGEK